MKRSRKLLILTLILMALICGVLVVTLLQPEETVDVPTETALIPITTDQITSMSWTYKGETVSVIRAESGWAYADDPSVLLADTKLHAMALDLVGASASRVITEPDVLSSYELDAPICEITVTTEDQTYSIAIGGTSAISGAHFLSTGDGFVYVEGTSTLLDTFSVTLDDIRIKEELTES